MRLSSDMTQHLQKEMIKNIWHLVHERKQRERENPFVETVENMTEQESQTASVITLKNYFHWS